MSSEKDIKNVLLPCPVCDRTFDVDAIEHHVNKCLFLNTKQQSLSKRSSSHFDEKLSQEKKMKTESIQATSSKLDDMESKTPRKRDANFTADEKALLARLIKKRPVVESKVNDGKSIAKKQAAWDSITREFNCNPNVHKRATVTLKRAWDNMKALARKSRSTERENLKRTRDESHSPPQPPQHEPLITLVEEAAPVMICKLETAFDNDGMVLDANDTQELVQSDEQQTSVSVDKEDSVDDNTFEVQENVSSPQNIHNNAGNSPEYMDKNILAERRPIDYIRREAVLRIKHLEIKKKIEMQILRTQLEVEQIKRKAALLEEQRNKVLLEKAMLELDKVKKTNGDTNFFY